MTKTSAAIFAALALTSLPLSAQVVTGGTDQVNLRVIHAVPGAPAANITIGSTTLFENVQFQQVTAFKALPEQDDKTVKISLADGRTLQTKEEFSFDDDDSQYTILIAPDDSSPNPKVVVLEDDVEDIDGDETEITLINASPSNKSASLSLDDNKLEGGVNYGDSDDEDVKPGTYQLRVTDSASDNVVARRNVTLTGGTAVTVVLIGQDAVKVVNNSMPDQDLSSGSAAATGGAALGTTATGAMTNISTTTGTAIMQEGRQPGTGTMVDHPTTPTDDM